MEMTVFVNAVANTIAILIHTNICKPLVANIAGIALDFVKQNWRVNKGKELAMPEFFVCAKNQVHKKVKQLDITHLVTLIDPGAYIFKPNSIPPENWLWLRFEDDEDPCGVSPPNLWHAERILDVGKQFPQDARVLVHCHAGICRSTAAALALWLQANGTDRLEEAIEWLASERPLSCPNMLLASFFDDLLEMNGEFKKACDKIGENSVKRKFSL